MPKYHTLAPTHGKDTVRFLSRVKQGKGTIVANFYAVVGSENACLVALTLATKDRSGKLCKARGLDGDDRKAAGVIAAPKSARGLLVMGRTGQLMFWKLSDLSVQGQEATDKALRLGIKKLCTTADEFKPFKGRYDIGSGDREAFDAWWSEWGSPDEAQFLEGNLDHLADEMGIPREELDELTSNREAIQQLMVEMAEADQPVDRSGLQDAIGNLASGLERRLSPKGQEDFDLALRDLTNMEGRNDADEWPEVITAPFADARLKADRLRTSDLDAAIDVLNKATAEVDRRAKQLAKLEKIRRKLGDRLGNAADTLEGYVSDVEDEIPPRLTALQEDHGRARQTGGAWGRIIDLGRWDLADSKLEEVRKAIAQVAVDVLNYRWEADMALEISQSTYSPDDGNEALLSQLDSEGVCLAMSLDWLGHGGSKADPGEKKQGDVSASHLKWQAVYELSKDLGQRDDKAGDLLAVLGGDHRPRSDIERDKAAVEARIRELQAPIERASQFANSHRQAMRYTLDDLETANDFVSYYLQAIEDEKGGEEALRPLRRDLASSEEDRDRLQSEVDLVEQEIAEHKRLAERALPLIGSLRDELEVLKQEERALDKAGKKLMAQAEKMGRRFLELEDQWRQSVVNDGMKPESALNAYGLKAKEGTGVVSDFGSEDVGAKVREFVTQMLDAPDAGAEISFSISVSLTEGAHAIACRVKAPDVDSTDWDIEGFDPNFGGFRFTTRERALTWFVDLAVRCYSENAWTGVSRHEVERTEEGPSSGGLHGDDASQDWTRDYGIVIRGLPALSDLSPAPTNALEQVEVQRLRVDNRLKGAPTKLDYKAARIQLNRLRSMISFLATAGPEVAWLNVELIRMLDYDDVAHDSIFTVFGRGLRLWEEGDASKGRQELRTAHRMCGSVGLS